MSLKLVSIKWCLVLAKPHSASKKLHQMDTFCMECVPRSRILRVLHVTGATPPRSHVKRSKYVRVVHLPYKNTYLVQLLGCTVLFGQHQTPLYGQQFQCPPITVHEPLLTVHNIIKALIGCIDLPVGCLHRKWLDKRYTLTYYLCFPPRLCYNSDRFQVVVVGWEAST